MGNDLIARPKSEYRESYGDVLWWTFPVEEPPFYGSPLSPGRFIDVVVREDGKKERTMRVEVGGWPGYHTNWTPVNYPLEPA